MHIKIVGISVKVVSMTTIDHGTAPPGVPGICRNPPELAGNDAGGLTDLVALELGDSLSGPSGAGSARAGPRSIHGIPESGTERDSCAIAGAADASNTAVKIKTFVRVLRRLIPNLPGDQSFPG